MAKPNWVRAGMRVKKILMDNPELADELELKIKEFLKNGK